MSDLSIVEVTRPDLMAALELWFFRDLSDEQRGKLFDLLYGAERGAEIQGMYIQRTFLRSAFARHRASEAERVREACAKVADECSAAFDRERTRIPDGDAHWYLAGKRDGAISIAAAIRSLPIGGE